MHEAGGYGRSLERRDRFGLQVQCFLLFLDPGTNGDLRGWHPHDLVGGAVCLMFEWIVDAPDSELRLYETRRVGCGQGRGCLLGVCPVRRKYWNLAEIPRDTRRRSPGSQIRWVILLLMTATGSVSDRVRTFGCLRLRLGDLRGKHGCSLFGRRGYGESLPSLRTLTSMLQKLGVT